MNEPVRLTPILCVLLALGLAACGPAGSPSAIPSPSGAPSTSPSPASSAPSSSPAASESACGPSASPCASPTASAATASACPISETTLELSSDRMTTVQVEPAGNLDLVRFGFGPPSSDPSKWETTPTVTVMLAKPPFAADPSGLPLDVKGSRVVLVRMQGMSLYDEAGVGTYQGPARLDEAGPGVRSVVRAGAFEGYETWLVGFDGPGCLGVALAGDGSLELRIAHP